MNKVYLLLALMWVAVSAASFASATPQEPSGLKEKIEQACVELDPQGVSVAVVKNGQVELTFSYGKRSAVTGQPMKNRSLYNIASLTKAFTAASIAKLVHDDSLEWKDKVSDYIPEFKLADSYITRELNIIDILAHRSGLSTFTGDLLWYQTDYTNEQIIERMSKLPVENDFRSEFGYQNNMYMIAGELIERITGKTWSRYLRDNFLDPLEMEDTYTSPGQLSPDANVAYPHYKEQQLDIYRFQAVKPAASIYSNVKDLARWVNMWLGEGKWQSKTIIEGQALEPCLAPHTLLDVSSAEKQHGTRFKAYGLGWSISDHRGVKIVEHGGGMPGYLSRITMVPEQELGIVILNNGFDLFIRQTIKNIVMDHYLEQWKEENWVERSLEARKSYEKRQQQSRQKRLDQRVPNTNTALSLEDYTGRYSDRFYGDARVKMKDGELHLSLLPASETFTSEMEHWHHNTFRVDFKDPFLPFGLITFDLDSKGRVSGFSIDLPSQDFHFQNLYFKPKKK